MEKCSACGHGRHGKDDPCEVTVSTDVGVSDFCGCANCDHCACSYDGVYNECCYCGWQWTGVGDGILPG